MNRFPVFGAARNAGVLTRYGEGTKLAIRKLGQNLYEYTQCIYFNTIFMNCQACFISNGCVKFFGIQHPKASNIVVEQGGYLRFLTRFSSTL